MRAATVDSDRRQSAGPPRAAGHASWKWPDPRPRVIIADAHRLVVAGLERLLEPYCEVVGIANNGEGLMAALPALHPTIVLVDIAMRPTNGLALLRDIRRADPSIKVIVVTMNPDPEVAVEAIRSGAAAYVLKNCAASELVEAVRHVTEGEPYVTPLVAGKIIDSLMKASQHHDADDHLTYRQREVLRLLAGGKSMKEVADVLNLTPRTVAFHKYRMMKQLNIKTSAELVRFAVARQIV